MVILVVILVVIVSGASHPCRITTSKSRAQVTAGRWSVNQESRGPLKSMLMVMPRADRRAISE